MEGYESISSNAWRMARTGLTCLIRAASFLIVKREGMAGMECLNQNRLAAAGDG